MRCAIMHQRMIELQPDIELNEPDAERILSAWRSEAVACTSLRKLSGGMVNSVYELEFDREPGRAVVKLHGPAHASFEREAGALEYLRRETTCPVPGVLLQDSSATVMPYAFLLLEHVDGACLDHVELTPDERVDVDAQLASILADLHTGTGSTWGRWQSGERFGSWSELLMSRLTQVRSQPTVGQRLPSNVLADVDRAIVRVPELLDDGGAPAIVHGDVWNGNVIVRREGDRWQIAALLDPDLQYADAEHELAYLEVFDQPRPELFAAYTARRPLRDGYEQRRLCSWLHTALVHVALFDEEFFREFTARTAAQMLELP